jgi:hypothetical protein
MMLLPAEVQKTTILDDRRQPAHLSPSITAQGARFTYHYYLKGQDRFTPMEEIFPDSLEKITIPADFFEQLLVELDICGINEAQLFPNLAGLARHINRTRLKLPS